MEDIITVLKSLRVGFVIEEYILQSQISNLLLSKNIAFFKEYVLGPRNRIDFFIPQTTTLLEEKGVGIEVKKGKPNAQRLLQQLTRYAQFDVIQGLIVVTERPVTIPTEIEGKPIELVCLRKLWGESL